MKQQGSNLPDYFLPQVSDLELDWPAMETSPSQVFEKTPKAKTLH
jgi:hypothetical protein